MTEVPDNNLSDPLFVTATGRRATKAEVIKLMNDLTSFGLGPSGGDVFVTRWFTGHSLHRSGAQEWLLRGLLRDVIIALGRWGPGTIAKYLDQVGASEMSSASFLLLGHQDCNAASPQFSLRPKKLRPFESKRKDIEEKQFVPLDNNSTTRKCIHVVDTFTGASHCWTTFCGWRFGGAIHSI